MHNALLRYVDEVARQGSIRKAAKVLNVASSAVNRQILKVEEEFGAKLFTRLPDGVELTAVGQAFVEHCRKTLHDFQEVRATIDDIRDLRTGHIRISTLDSMTFGFLPEVLHDFAKDFPGVSYVVATATPEETMTAVANGDADIGLSFTRSVHPDVRLIAEKPSPFGAILRPNHPLADRHFVSLVDCSAYPLVRTIDARGHTSIIDADKDPLIEPLSTVFFTNSLVMAKHAIRSEFGIGVYTKIGFIDDVKSGSLRFVPLSDKPLNNYRVGAFVSAQKYIDTPTRLLLNVIERHFRDNDFT